MKFEGDQEWIKGEQSESLSVQVLQETCQDGRRNTRNLLRVIHVGKKEGGSWNTQKKILNCNLSLKPVKEKCQQEGLDRKKLTLISCFDKVLLIPTKTFSAKAAHRGVPHCTLVITDKSNHPFCDSSLAKAARGQSWSQQQLIVLFMVGSLLK